MLSFASQRCLVLSQDMHVAKQPLRFAAPKRPWRRTAAPGRKAIASCAACSLRFSGLRAFSTLPSRLTSQRPLASSQLRHVASLPLSSGEPCKPARRTLAPGQSSARCPSSSSWDQEGAFFPSAGCGWPPPSSSSPPKSTTPSRMLAWGRWLLSRSDSSGSSGSSVAFFFLFLPFLAGFSCSVRSSCRSSLSSCLRASSK
mmetsp:Transcript_90317/g.292314  ORF Transcript_90317/g.292314 Transcript_90317/m.292314 type:complete len:200 (-) Transcript_90317:274-873(-)